MEQTASGNAFRTMSAARAFDLIIRTSDLTGNESVTQTLRQLPLQSMAKLTKDIWAAVPNPLGRAENLTEHHPSGDGHGPIFPTRELWFIDKEGGRGCGGTPRVLQADFWDLSFTRAIGGDDPVSHA
jgi:hypothetical protein